MRITTLIPAFKPRYFIELLICLRRQTVKPHKIILSDDSPDATFTHMLTTEPLRRLVQNLNIELVQGPRTGARTNSLQVLQMLRMQAGGPTELFHLLFDDDMIYPTFYEQHLKAHQAADLKCVISRRWTATESGQPIRDDQPVPSIVETSTHRMLVFDAPMLFAQTVGASKNWLGEFSNATFKSDMSILLEDPRIGGISCVGLEDLGAFLNASLLGRVGYIQDHLGCFRQSADQNSANPMGRPLKLAFLAYISLAIAGRNMNVLDREQSRQAVQRASLFILQHYQQETDMQDMCAVLRRLALDESAEPDFLALWKVFSTPIDLLVD